MPEHSQDGDVRIAVIAALNDDLRAHLSHENRNQIVMTEGIRALIEPCPGCWNFNKQAEMLRLIRDFNAFGGGNNPYGERDFGRFEFEGTDCH